MEEKLDHPAVDELPLFSGENTEDISEQTSADQAPSALPDAPKKLELGIGTSTPVAEEVAVEESVAEEVVEAEESAAEEVAVEESVAEEVVEEPPVVQVPSVSAASVGGTGNAGVKLPVGLVPSPDFGVFLRRAREANGISLDELARITRIKKGYLEAVEQENYKDLPAVVYALAYINTLADYYGVDADGKAVLTSEIRKHLAYEAPEENKTVISYERSAENQILLRRILFAGAGMVVLLAILITLAVLFFTTGGSEGGGSGAVQGGAPAGLDETHLVEIQPAPSLQTHVLPVPKR